MEYSTRCGSPYHSGQTIKIFAAPYFLATKFEAFLARGQQDLLLARDLEDIVAVLDGRGSALAEMRSSALNVRAYLAEQARAILDGGPIYEDVLRGHLPYGGSDSKRFTRLMAAFRDMAELT